MADEGVVVPLSFAIDQAKLTAEIEAAAQNAARRAKPVQLPGLGGKGGAGGEASKVAGLTSELGKLSQVASRLPGPLGQVGNSIGRLSSMGEAASQAGALSGEIGGLAAGAGVAVGALAALAAATKYTVGTLLSATSAARQTQRAIGGTIQDASRLNEAFSDVGVSTAELTQGLVKFTRGLGTKNLRDLGVTAGSTKEAIVQLAAAYQKAGTSAERANLLTTAFGRGGVKAAALLERGPEGVKALLSANEGLVVNPEDVRAQKEFNRSLDEIADSAKQAAMEIGRTLLPVITQLTQLALKPITFVVDIVTKGTNLVDRAKNFVYGNGFNTAQNVINKQQKEFAQDFAGVQDGSVTHLGAFGGYGDGARQEIEKQIEAYRELTPNTEAARVALKRLQDEVKFAGPGYDDLTARVNDLDTALNNIGDLRKIQDGAKKPVSMTDAAQGVSDGTYTPEQYIGFIKAQVAAQDQLAAKQRQIASARSDIAKAERDYAKAKAGDTESQRLDKQVKAITLERGRVDAIRAVSAAARGTAAAERALAAERAIAGRPAQALLDAEEGLFRARREQSRVGDKIAGQERDLARARQSAEDAKRGIGTAEQQLARSKTSLVFAERQAKIDAMADVSAKKQLDIASLVNREAQVEIATAADRLELEAKRVASKQELIDILEKQRQAELDALDAATQLDSLSLSTRGSDVTRLLTKQNIGGATSDPLAAGFASDARASQAAVEAAQAKTIEFERRRSEFAAKQNEDAKTGKELAQEQLDKDLARVEASYKLADARTAVTDAEYGVRDAKQSAADAAQSVVDKEQELNDARRDAYIDAAKNVRDAENGVFDARVAIRDETQKLKDLEQAVDDARYAQIVTVENQRKGLLQYKAEVARTKEEEAARLETLKTKLDDLNKKRGDLAAMNKELNNLRLLAEGKEVDTGYGVGNDRSRVSALVGKAADAAATGIAANKLGAGLGAGPTSLASSLFDNIKKGISDLGVSIAKNPVNVPVKFTPASDADKRLLEALTRIGGVGTVGATSANAKGAREFGGPVTGGENYVVNEARREWFQDQSGHLTPIPGGIQLWRAPASGRVVPSDSAAAQIVNNANVGKNVQFGDIHINTAAKTPEAGASLAAAVISLLGGL